MSKRSQIDIQNYIGFFDVPYNDISETCKLDIYLPDGKGPFPVIVSIHGGAFKKCDKRDADMIEDMLHGLEKGYAVAGVNYRLSSEAQFPDPVRDVKQAVQFLKNHADHYQLDQSNIVVWGGSAGGYMALMASVIESISFFDTEKNQTPSTVQGVVSWFPPVNFLTMDDQLRESGFLDDKPDHASDTSPESLFIGAPINKNRYLVQLANPETYIHKDMCPIFIQHGRDDKIVPYQGSEHFAHQAKEKCGDDRINYEIIEYADHGDPLFSTKENLAKVFSFIETCFTKK